MHPPQIYLIDHDGCLIAKGMEGNFTKFQGFLTSRLKELPPETLVILAIASVRQSRVDDIHNAANFQNGSVFAHMVQLLNKMARDLPHLNFKLFLGLTGDVWQQVPLGTNFAEGLIFYNKFQSTHPSYKNFAVQHPNFLHCYENVFINDDEKLFLLYFLLHAITGAIGSATKLNFYFIDDNLEILESLVRFLERYSDVFLPKRMTLECIGFDAIKGALQLKQQNYKPGHTPFDPYYDKTFIGALSQRDNLPDDASIDDKWGLLSEAYGQHSLILQLQTMPQSAPSAPPVKAECNCPSGFVCPHCLPAWEVALKPYDKLDISVCAVCRLKHMPLVK